MPWLGPCYTRLPPLNAGDVVGRFAGQGVAPEGVDRGVWGAQEPESQRGVQERSSSVQRMWAIGRRIY